MATVFSTEFDLATFDGTKVDGDPANLDTENPGGASSPTSPGLTNRTGANGWAYETSSKASGTASITTSNDAGATSVWTFSHGATVTTGYYDQCFKVTTLPAAESIIGQIRLGGTNKAQITLDNAGVVRIKNGTTTVDQTASGFVTANQWFRWKWGITGTTQELRLYIDATPANLFGTTTDDTLTGSYTGGGWDQYRLGIMSGAAGAIDVWLDRFVVDDSTWPTSGGSNVAPVADAGPDDDTYEGGDTVTLDGTGSSDSDGSIASYAWTQVSGPAVSLSSATASQPTFVAPATAGVATFELRVTDDDGTQSAADSVTIEWSDAPVAPPTSDFYDLLTGAAPPTALSTGNTGFDTVDSGWTFRDNFAGVNIGAAQVSGSGAVKILTHNLASLVSDGYMDAIFQIDDLSVGPWYIMRVLDGSTLRASVRVNTNGSIQCRNGTTAVGTETAGRVTEGEPFRVAWRAQNGSPGTQRARLYTGANLFGSDAGYSETSGNFNTGTYNRCGYGIAAPAVASGTLYLAIPQQDAADYPEPYGADTAVTSGVYKLNADGSVTPLEAFAL